MEDDKIKEILEKQEETLILVKKLWRAEKWRRYWAILRYVIYIGILLGAFYFLIPYIEKIFNLVQIFHDVKNPQDFQNFLQQLQSK